MAQGPGRPLRLCYTYDYILTLTQREMVLVYKELEQRHAGQVVDS
jgi:hypothetical protein